MRWRDLGSRSLPHHRSRNKYSRGSRADGCRSPQLASQLCRLPLAAGVLKATSHLPRAAHHGHTVQSLSRAAVDQNDAPTAAGIQRVHMLLHVHISPYELKGVGDMVRSEHRLPHAVRRHEPIAHYSWVPLGYGRQLWHHTLRQRR